MIWIFLYNGIYFYQFVYISFFGGVQMNGGFVYIGSFGCNCFSQCLCMIVFVIENNINI